MWRIALSRYGRPLMMRQLRTLPSTAIVHFAMTVPLTPATIASRGGKRSPPESSTGRDISGPKGSTDGGAAAGGAAAPGAAAGGGPARAGAGAAFATAAPGAGAR